VKLQKGLDFVGNITSRTNVITNSWKTVMGFFHCASILNVPGMHTYSRLLHV